MKDFIPYKEALALKELGFDNINCLGVYFGNFTEDERSWDFGDADGFVLSDRGTQYYAQKGFRDGILAPLYSQAFRFFRGKGYDSEILRSPIVNTLYRKKYDYNIWIDNEDEFDTAYAFDTYEEAELECLRKLIEIVKTK